MFLKKGVRLNDLSPQILVSVMAAKVEYDKLDAPLVITSCNDGKHSTHSLHYVGHAVDLRTRHLPLTDNGKSAFALRIWSALGGITGQFDVIFEGAGTANEHIHIEYQPHTSAGK